MIRTLDYVEVVLDYNDRVASIHELVKHRKQFVHIRKVQTRRRLVQDVQRLARAPLCELRCKLDSLRLAARKLCRRLTELDVPESDLLQRLKVPCN